MLGFLTQKQFRQFLYFGSTAPARAFGIWGTASRSSVGRRISAPTGSPFDSEAA
jgi:hypothetical protein